MVDTNFTAGLLSGNDGLNKGVEKVASLIQVVDASLDEEEIARFCAQHPTSFDKGSKLSTDGLAEEMRGRADAVNESQSLLNGLKRKIVEKRMVALLLHDGRNQLAHLLAAAATLNGKLLPLADASKAELDELTDELRALRVVIDTKLNGDRVSETEKAVLRQQLSEVNEALEEANTATAEHRDAAAAAQASRVRALAMLAEERALSAVKDEKIADLQSKAANPFRTMLGVLQENVLNSTPLGRLM